MDLRRALEMLRGQRFEAVCQALLVAEFPEAQAVDGRAGDGGVDATTVSRDTVFQMYAPDSPNRSKLSAKIDQSVRAAAARRSEYGGLRRLVLVTPFDLERTVLDRLERGTREAGLEGVSWGLSKLAELATRHDHVCRAFVELREVMPPGGTTSSPHELGSHDNPTADMIHHLGLVRTDTVSGKDAYCDARFGIRVFVPTRATEPIDGAVEDVFCAEVVRAFPRDEGAVLSERLRNGVRVDHRGARFHRSWGMFVCGEIGAALSLESAAAPGTYSLSDVAIDLLRALQLGSWAGDDSAATLIRFSMLPYRLEARGRSADARMRSHIAGVSQVGALRRDAPYIIGLPFTLREVRTRPHELVGRLLGGAVRDLHGARVDTPILVNSIAGLLAAERDAQLR